MMDCDEPAACSDIDRRLKEIDREATSLRECATSPLQRPIIPSGPFAPTNKQSRDDKFANGDGAMTSQDTVDLDRSEPETKSPFAAYEDLKARNMLSPDDIALFEDYKAQCGGEEAVIDAMWPEDRETIRTSRWHVALQNPLAKCEEIIEFEDEYLGDEWCELIEKLYYTEPAKPTENMTELKDYQLKAAGQGHYLCRSSFRAMLLADDMGVGKSRTCIKIMDLAKDEPGSFSVVVCPKPLELQWAQEIHASYQPGHAPLVHILDDKHTTAHELLASGCEIVIVSFEFLESSARSIQQWDQKVEKFGNNESVARDITALLSPFWRAVNKPIKRLIIDECQKIKSEGIRQAVVSSLYFNACVLVSGTILDNTWRDCTALVCRFVKGLPFTSREDLEARFMTVCYNDNEDALDCVLSKDITLISRFLMAFTVARPSSILELKGLKAFNVNFELNEEEQKETTKWTQKYVRNLRKLALSTDDDPEGNPLAAGIRAQQASAHPLLHTAGLMGGENAYELQDARYDSEHVSVHTALKAREAWRKKLSETDGMYDSSRIRALVATYYHCRKQYPNEKILIFSEFLTFLDVVAAALNARKINVFRYDGSCGPKQRDKTLNSFKSAPVDEPLLVTARSGGVGLNLQVASVIIQTEGWWNHNWELQAYGRAVRHGQQRLVKIFKLNPPNDPFGRIIQKKATSKARQNLEIMKNIYHKPGEELTIPGTSMSHGSILPEMTDAQYKGYLDKQKTHQEVQAALRA